MLPIRPYLRDTIGTSMPAARCCRRIWREAKKKRWCGGKRRRKREREEREREKRGKRWKRVALSRDKKRLTVRSLRDDPFSLQRLEKDHETRKEGKEGATVYIPWYFRYRVFRLFERTGEASPTLLSFLSPLLLQGEILVKVSIQSPNL